MKIHRYRSWGKKWPSYWPYDLHWRNWNTFFPRPTTKKKSLMSQKVMGGEGANDFDTSRDGQLMDARIDVLDENESSEKSVMQSNREVYPLHYTAIPHRLLIIHCNVDVAYRRGIGHRYVKMFLTNYKKYSSTHATKVLWRCWIEQRGLWTVQAQFGPSNPAE